MRMLLAGLIAAVVLGWFAQTALQAAGDTWPNGGARPPVISVAGDTWPNGG